PPRVEARPFDPAAGGLPGDPAFVDDDLDAAATPLTATIGEAWALRTLPRDMRLTGVPPADPGGERGPWNDFDEPAEAEASIRLVVYLPDGSALLRTTTWFVDEAETRRVRLEVSGFTGVPTLTTVDPDADPEAAPDAEPEEADGARGRRGPGDPRAPGLQPFAGDPP
ncbi:MAG: hypothetical protein KJO43_09000, partial [Phycisphaerae bacterium]|nr:hypothetical protein [Phycisphaerae bacterium]